MIRVEFSDSDDVSDLISALLEAAERWEHDRPMLARKYRRLADRIGDELDSLPYPSGFRASVEAARERHLHQLQRTS